MKVLIVSARPAWARILSAYLTANGNETEIVAPPSFVPERSVCDLLLLDWVQLPGAARCCFSAARSLRGAWVVALVSRPSDYIAQVARLSGCRAVLSEADDLADWEAIFERLGRFAFQAGRSFQHAPSFLALLSRRQVDVYERVIRGLSDEEIGVELGITTSTAETHRSDLQVKLKRPGHSEIMLHAIQHGVIDPRDLPPRSPIRAATRRHGGAK